MKRIWACITAAFLVGLMAAPAGASTMAPTYVSSEPSDGEDLHRAPDRVEVTFSEPLDESSELSVKDSCGRRVDDGRVAVDGNTMSVGISLKPSGHYQVSYTATGLAGLTGSTDGGFHFMVHLGEKCDGGKKGGGHNKHGGSNNEGNSNQGNNHNEHEGSGGGRNEPEHTSMGSGGAHSTATNRTGGHAGSDRSTDKRHQGMHGDGDKKRTNKHGKHGKSKVTVDDPNDGRTLAAGPAQPVAPDGRAVMFALVFSLALGSIGGWFLRVSAAR